MKVKELLEHIAPTLSKHDFCIGEHTLIIDIKHNYKFHAYAEISGYDIKNSLHESYILTSPFSESFYKSYDSKNNKNIFLSVLDDFEVYSWSLEYIDNDKIDKKWMLKIETHNSYVR